MIVRTVGIILSRVSLAVLGLAAVLAFMGWLVRPDLSAQPRQYSPEAIQAAVEARTPTIDLDNLPHIQVDVDYGKGQRAAWYPKGESPILAELVDEGKLPPLAERIGQEPCVLRGIDGIGRYGGTWIYLAGDGQHSWICGHVLAGCTLLRWSPQGYPVVPHVAKSYTVSEDNRVFTVELRKGMKWSDGHPFTADDIMYWWKEELNDPAVPDEVPALMKVRGKTGTIEKLGPHTLRFSFPEPYGTFPEKLANGSDGMCNRPAHYLRQFHPSRGDPQAIANGIRKYQLQSPLQLYLHIRTGGVAVPDYPRLWPWVFRSDNAKPPQQYVRNPYYWVVDEQGNQLPYIDRVLVEAKNADMIVMSMSNGEATSQGTHMEYSQYTMLMEQRERGGYDLYHWYPATRSLFVIQPNLNRRIDPDRPETKWKHQLFNDKRFRQALSLAIDRKAIIRAEYHGVGEPAQVAPGPNSFFYEPRLYNAFTQYDPDRANALLDEIGLTQRDAEGYRTYPDGTRMTFFFAVAQWRGPDQFVVDDWANVGIRAVTRNPGGRLFYTQKLGLQLDFCSFGSNGEFLPLLAPRCFVPVDGECNYAIGFGRWYQAGGLYGDPAVAGRPGLIEPPLDHPLRRAMEVYEAASAESDINKQREIFNEALLIAADNLWTINICTAFPQVTYVKKGLHNVPKVAAHSWPFHTPANTGPELYYFEEPYDSPGAVEQIKRAAGDAPPSLAGYATDAGENADGSPAGKPLPLLKWGFLLAAVLMTALIAVRHPYVGRRLLIMIPTLAIISVVVFVVIQLPPGDFLTSRIMELESNGRQGDLQQIGELRKMFHTEDPLPLQYARWMGLKWFIPSRIEVTDESGATRSDWQWFREEDKGLLQGHMGRSMATLQPVNERVGDRLLLTFLISLGTVLMTWTIAVPIGIYSAVRQYSPGDYILTFVGFIGMCVPGFLLALLLIFFSREYFNTPISGLFSSQFAAQPEWDWPKVIDLLKHIWIPVVVLGVGGTAGMIRVMRGNLLDELKRPYVTTARAKGVRPIKLLLKYPVRLALNPFISGIGGIFPHLVSGGAIVAMVLSLPTVGPLMLTALMDEDMSLAGSMLMVLSLLGIIGTLVSDLLLLWLDPRIRYESGGR